MRYTGSALKRSRLRRWALISQPAVLISGYSPRAVLESSGGPRAIGHSCARPFQAHINRFGTRGQVDHTIRPSGLAYAYLIHARADRLHRLPILRIKTALHEIQVDCGCDAGGLIAWKRQPDLGTDRSLLFMAIAEPTAAGAATKPGSQFGWLGDEPDLHRS